MEGCTQLSLEYLWEETLQEFSSQFNHQFPQLPKLMALTFSKQNYSGNGLMEDESRPIQPRNKTHSKGGMTGIRIMYLIPCDGSSDEGKKSHHLKAIL